MMVYLVFDGGDYYGPDFMNEAFSSEEKANEWIDDYIGSLPYPAFRGEEGFYALPVEVDKAEATNLKPNEARP